MPKQTTKYKDWLGAKLADPIRAERFLNFAQADSNAAFFKALRKVAMAQSRPMAEVAEAAGVSRESLYRMTSEESNPAYTSLDGILKTLGFRLRVERLSSSTSIVAGSGSGHIAVLDKHWLLANMQATAILEPGMNSANATLEYFALNPNGAQFVLGPNRRPAASGLGPVTYLGSANNSIGSAIHFGVSPQ